MDYFDIFINVLGRLASAVMICIYLLWGYYNGDGTIAKTTSIKYSKFKCLFLVIIGGGIVHVYNIKMDMSDGESLIELLVYFIPSLVGLWIGFRHKKVDEKFKRLVDKMKEINEP